MKFYFIEKFRNIRFNFYCIIYIVGDKIKWFDFKCLGEIVESFIKYKKIYMFELYLLLREWCLEVLYVKYEFNLSFFIFLI